MTHNEVVQKWDKTHHTALHAVLSFVDHDASVILIPKESYRHVVTSQICKDLGFYYAGTVSYEGKKAFYKYIREEKQ